MSALHRGAVPSRRLREEIRPLLALAGPVVAGEIGWVAMGVVDVMMVGRIDAESIGAVGVGRAVFFSVVIFGIGMLLGLDTLVAQAHGAGRQRECRDWLVQGLYLGIALSVPVLLAARGLGTLLPRWGVEPRVLALALPYLAAVSWSALPVLIFSALRRYLQATNAVRPVMIALISANLINAAGNWILIHGKLGAPALGAVGSAWATVGASWYLAAFLAVAVVLRERGEPQGLLAIRMRPELARLVRICRLGLPAALQLVLEVTVFALVTTLASRLAPAALAAHQIALNAASVTFMVPLGVSSAAAVRVGQALGRRDAEGASAAGFAGLAVGVAFMALAALVFAAVPAAVIRVFTAAADVARAGVPLLYVAAVFQLFDGLQVVATGALRGAGDTRTPMLAGLVAWWLVGLPISYGLCFGAGLGVIGLWVGLCVGLVLMGCILVPAWARRAARFA